MQLTRSECNRVMESTERIRELTGGIISDGRKKAINDELDKIKEIMRSASAPKK